VEFGFIGAVLIGLSLGLFGSGGSIITVPVLIYLFGYDAKLAIASSLLIVGLISLGSMIRASFRRAPNIKVILSLGVPGMFGALIGARLALQIPTSVQLAVFALLVTIAAYRMARPIKVASVNHSVQPAWFKVVLLGAFIGVITGVVGVGGGFMIVPVLVLLVRQSMVEAVATSLGIIFINSTVGFIGYWLHAEQAQLEFDYPRLLIIAAIGLVGSLVGSSLLNRLPEKRLRQSFSLVLIVMASLILYQSTI